MKCWQGNHTNPRITDLDVSFICYANIKGAIVR